MSIARPAVAALMSLSLLTLLAVPIAAQGGREVQDPERARERPDARPPGEAGEQERIMHALEMGRDAARRIGDEELATALQRAMERVRRGGSDAQAHERGARDRELHEARRQLEVLKIARHGLAEGNKQDAVELMDRAIRARELALEGRVDAEGMEIRRRAPERGAIVELLTMAAELWAHFGHEQKAKAVGELAAQMQGRGRAEGREREQAREEERRAVGEESEQRERERRAVGEQRGAREEHDEQYREMQRRLEEMVQRMEALQQQIEELRRRRQGE